MIYPLLWLLASSFKSNETMFTNTYSLLPEVWDAAKNYASGFAGIGGVAFSTFFMNSMVVTVVGTVTCVLSSLLAAYTFSRLKFRFSNFWFGCVMMTMMIPAQVMVVPQYIILKKIHLIDTRVALVLPWCFGGAKYTIPLALNMYLDPNSYNNYGGLFAMSVISLIPIVVFFIIFQRYLVDGIAMDGIKG